MEDFGGLLEDLEGYGGKGSKFFRGHGGVVREREVGNEIGRAKSCL